MTLQHDIQTKLNIAKKAIINLKSKPMSFECTAERAIKFTEQFFAEFFANNFQHNLRFDHTSGKWYLWKGSHWKQDRVKEIFDYFNTCLIMLLNDCKIQKDTEVQKKYFKFLCTCESHTKMVNILKLAGSVEGIRVTCDDFDNNPFLFNCVNCTIDLNGLIPVRREFDPNDNLTQLSNVIYDPNNKPVEFLKFMDTIFDSNKDIIEYIQRSLGYSLTGSTIEDVAFFMYGTGKNGKSTFIEIIKMVLGDYYQRIDMDSLIVKNHGSGINNDIACLKGARFVAGSEIEDNKKLNESLFKSLTGGDDMKARFLFKEFFTFTPNFKIWMAGNHKPIIKGTDYGMKRRVKLIPFTVKISDEITESRTDILLKMEREASGILNWILEGFIKWKKDGLCEPEIITNATEEYFNEMDLIKPFIDRNCETGEYKKEDRISVKKMFEKYVDYCNANKEEALSKHTFDKKLKEKGFLTESGNGNKVYWTNISVKK